MKRLLFIVLILSGAVFTTLLAIEDRGYLLMDFHGWIVETSVIAVAVVLVLVFAVLHLSLRFLRQVISAPRDMRAWRVHRKFQRANRSMVHGLLEFSAGNWHSSEKELLRYVSDAEQPVLNFLTAARAAQAQGQLDRRDRYLKLAYQSAGEHETAVRLTQADLQVEQKQWEQALASLRQLNTECPKHPWVLQNLIETSAQLQDWPTVIALLPELHRYKHIDTQKLDQLERQGHIVLLQQAAVKSATAIEQHWERIPTVLRADRDILAIYVQHLVHLGNSDIAEPLLRNALKQAWHDELVRLYGIINGADPAAQLRYAESWLPKHEKNPYALLTLGRLAARNQLWGKARGFLEASIGTGGPPEAYHALATLMDSLGEHDAATQYYRQGLAIVPGSECNNSCGAAGLEHRGSVTPLLLKSS